MAAERGDYRAAGAAGVKTAVLGAATVYGAGHPTEVADVIAGRGILRGSGGTTATQSGDAYSAAFRAELDAIRTEAATAGTALNRLLAP